jgi:hypothetical protein
MTIKLIIAAIVVALTLTALLAGEDEGQYLTYDEFVRLAEAGKIKQVKFVGKGIYFTGTMTVDGKEKSFFCGGARLPSADPLLTRFLQKCKVSIVKEQPKEEKTSRAWRRRVETEWKMADGQVIKIGDEGGKIELAGGRVLATLKAFESVHQVIQSESKKALLLLIMKRRPDSESVLPYGGSSFHNAALIVVRPKEKSGKETLEACRVLTEKTLATPEISCWASELGVVDDEGRLALIKVARHPNTKQGYRVEYGWETWDLNSEKMVSKGLHLPK